MEQPVSLIDQQTNNLAIILRDYLRDFGRHALEKQGAQRDLIRGAWWNEFVEVETTPQIVTRWQELAEKLWSLYLHLDFNPTDGKHLRLLARLYQVSSEKDRDLANIIQNYLNSL
eukprot:TRINITY_DN2615_c0_g1_i6.p1 TRINITY_DN2615_c0_g1~~TRINITY_DN2615_c0_g1_i6.p1  ORF type:complete len:115 (+),score=30.15 TRINITY_DN2615_c0_g1_i6:207-551(+)